MLISRFKDYWNLSWWTTQDYVFSKFKILFISKENRHYWYLTDKTQRSFNNGRVLPKLQMLAFMFCLKNCFGWCSQDFPYYLIHVSWSFQIVFLTDTCSLAFCLLLPLDSCRLWSDTSLAAPARPGQMGTFGWWSQATPKVERSGLNKH